MAAGAQLALHKTGHALSHQRALGVGEGVQHIPPGTGEGAHVARLQLALERGAGLGRREARIHRHRRRFLGEQDPVAVLLRQVLPRPVDVVSHANQDVAQVLALPGRWPRGDRTLADGQRGIGDHDRLGHLVHVAQAVTGGACPLRRVGREVFGIQHRLPGRIGACARVHHPHQTGEGGHAAHRGTRVAGASLLLQRHRGRQAFDRIDFRHARLIDQTPRIGCHGLEVASLGLGIEGAEGERRLPGAGDPREHHQRVARNGNIHILEVVLAGTAHLDEAAGGCRTRGFNARRAWHVLILWCMRE